jgi:hypothetical protein
VSPPRPFVPRRKPAIALATVRVSWQRLVEHVFSQNPVNPCDVEPGQGASQGQGVAAIGSRGEVNGEYVLKLAELEFSVFLWNC